MTSLNAILLACSMCISIPAHAQPTHLPERSQTFGVSFNAGYSKPIPGDRYRSTGDGYQVELAVRYSPSQAIWVGAGFLWSASPDVDAPEFDVFAPLDHPIWMEYSQFFSEVRYFPFQADAQVTPLSPYISGRLGWATEFAEYSGPTVTRSGLLMSTGGGTSIALTKNFALDVSAMFSIVGFGEANVFGEKVQGSSSLATYFGLRGGIEIWF